MKTAAELWADLQGLDESVELEVKEGSAADKFLWETISAFSNEPGLGGGDIVLGIRKGEESELFPKYSVVGVLDPDSLQADFANQCNGQVFNTHIRPEIRVEQLEGKRVLVIRVHEAPPSIKPVYIKSRGLPKGAYRRIGSSDVACADGDLAILYGKHDVSDTSPVASLTWEDIDVDAIAFYRQLRAKVNP